MKIEEAIRILKDAQSFLRKKHVIHAGVFGSVARGDAGPNSDVDILIDFEPNALVSIYDFVAVSREIGGMFPQGADVVEGEGLRPALRKSVMRDLINAF